MDTKTVEISGDKIKDDIVFAQAADIIRKGGLVAFPTETVYGLGGNTFLEEAAKKIYKAKGRPSDNPLIVHIADLCDINRVCDTRKEQGASTAAGLSGKAALLAKAFWPGPLTMILKKKKEVPYDTTGGLETVAVRMPDSDIARRLIRESGVPIAAPSANISGRPSPTQAVHVEEDLSGRIDMIIKSDPSRIGIESTIVDMTADPPVILRPGDITQEDLEEVIGRVEIDPAVNGSARGSVPKAPGMKYKHYAPRAEMCLVFSSGEPSANGAVADKIAAMAREVVSGGMKCAIITTEENIKKYKEILDNKDVTDEYILISMGKRSDLKTVERGIFSALREADVRGADKIYCEGFAPLGRGLSIMNRLIKAAGGNIIEI